MPVKERSNPSGMAAVTDCLHPDVAEAFLVLEGRALSADLALRLARLSGPSIFDLANLAHKVQNKFSPGFHACSILNAKSGSCQEDCKFCAQSGHHQAQIEVYPLLDPDAVMQAARRIYSQGVRRLGLVTSGTGYAGQNPEWQKILGLIRALHAGLPDLEVCGSFGILDEPAVAGLAQAGIGHYNLNLQVAPKRYAELVATTHAVESRIATLRLLKTHGIRLCTGGILGMGETMEDRVSLALTLRDLDIDVIPLNVLIPVAGTALADQPPMSVAEAVKTFALFRLILPKKIIKFAAGRETRMKDFQGLLLLAGANGLLTGGYLTTRGRAVHEDFQLLRDLEGWQK